MRYISTKDFVFLIIRRPDSSASLSFVQDKMTAHEKSPDLRQGFGIIKQLTRQRGFDIQFYYL